MPKVWNKRDPNCPKDAVYVGRPTKWGNPFTHMNGTTAKFKVKDRKAAIQWYTKWLWEDSPLQNAPNGGKESLIATAKRELYGKDLVCWCAPLDCHADILLEIANE